jgi:hypothetical protein
LKTGKRVELAFYPLERIAGQSAAG